MDSIEEIINNLEFEDITKVLKIVKDRRDVLETELRNKFYNACEDADVIRVQELIKLIRMKRDSTFFNTEVFDHGLIAVCKPSKDPEDSKRRIEIAKLMIDNGADTHCSFSGVCKGGNLEIFKMLFGTWWKHYFKDVCKGGHLELVEFYTEVFVDDINDDYWNYGFEGACDSGHLHIVEFIYQKYNEKHQINFNKLFNISCISGYIPAVIFISEKASENNFKFDWNYFYNHRDRYQYYNIKVIDLLLSKAELANKEHLEYTEYDEYKQEQLLKFTKMHESLVSMIKY